MIRKSNALARKPAPVYSFTAYMKYFFFLVLSWRLVCTPGPAKCGWLLSAQILELCDYAFISHLILPFVMSVLRIKLHI